MVQHVQAFRESHEKDLQFILMAEKELKAIINKDHDHPYVLRVIDFGKKVYEAYIDWSRETIRFLEGIIER
jgi:hypothetical protein